MFATSAGGGAEDVTFDVAGPVGWNHSGTDYRVTPPEIANLETPEKLAVDQQALARYDIPSSAIQPKTPFEPADILVGAADTSYIPKLFIPLLATYQVEFVPPAEGKLADFQVISGPTPSVGDGESATWTTTTPVDVILRDINAQKQADHGLFIAGISLGIAGGAIVALLLEILSAIIDRNKKPADAP